MKAFVGIDVGRENVKLVQLFKTRKGLVLKKAGMISFRELPFADELPFEQTVLEAIRWLFAQNNIKKAHISLSLPADLIYSKYISLPPVAEDKIEQIIQFEARSQIPFDLDEVSWSYQILGKRIGAEETSVLLSAIKNTVLLPLLAGAPDNELSIRIVDVLPMALYNVLNYQQHVYGTILVDIGHSASSLVIVGKDICYTRNLPFGGADIHKAMSEQLFISELDAERFKKEVGFHGEGDDAKRSEVLEQAVSTLLKEIQRTIGYYRSNNGELIILKMVLSGGNSKIQGLTEYFAKEFSCEVELYDPFRNILLDPEMAQDNLNNVAQFFSGAVGLSLRHQHPCLAQVNLLPKEVQEQHYVARNKWFIWLWSVLVVALSAMVIVSAQQQTEQMRKEVKQAKSSLQNFQKMEKQQKSLLKSIAPVQQKLDILNDVLRDRLHLLDVLVAFKKVTISDMYYEQWEWGLNLKEQKMLEEFRADKGVKKQKAKSRVNVPSKTESRNDHRYALKVTAVSSDNYQKIDSLRIALSSHPMISDVYVTEAKEWLDGGRKKIRFKMLVEFESNG